MKEEVIFGSTIERAKYKLDELFDEIINSSEKVMKRSRCELVTNLRRIKVISINSEMRDLLLHVAYIDNDIFLSDSVEYVGYVIDKSRHYYDGVRVEYF